MRITRVYSGDDGRSHFEDLDIGLDFGALADRTAPIEVRDIDFRRSPQSVAGGELHNSSNRQFVVTLEGVPSPQQRFLAWDHGRLAEGTNDARLKHVPLQLEPGVVGVSLAVKPIGAHLTAATDPAPFPDQVPVTEETGHDFHSVEPVQFGLGFDPGEMHASYPHILDAMSCSSLPTASA